MRNGNEKKKSNQRMNDGRKRWQSVCPKIEKKKAEVK